ncbi:hypothetical protein SBA3_3800022 [Candidatus Sulfopaludibacter sp. SbA3]|nr:hypothetical protein SBA3_3800022 [Candidatus Sulfopaludibacter sp. SbA3]
MSDLNSCGCCAAVPELDPIDNRPGLSSLAYRIGVYGSFLQRLLDQIYSVQLPSGPNQGAQPLAALTTRSPDDASIALLDAWAVIADVLTFYQERIANEGFLRTATERRSILELARAIGYELAPGVASNVLLQFTVDNIIGAPISGSPAPASSPFNSGMVAIPAGTQVQSIPAASQQPQTFETSADFVARVERNQLAPRLQRTPDLALYKGGIYVLGTSTGFQPGMAVSLPVTQLYLLNPATSLDPSLSHVLAVEMNQLYLQGITTNLKQGDRVLLVGSRNNTTKTQNFIVNNVETNSAMNSTCVSFSDNDLPTPTFEPFPFPPAALSLQKMALTQENAVSQIIDTHISEGDLDALIQTNGWDPAQLAKLVNTAPTTPSSQYGAFAMRATCGFFGHNAVLWNSLPNPATAQRADPYPQSWDTPNNGQGRLIWTDSQGQSYADADVFLERTFPQVLANSWAIFESSGIGAATYQVSGVVEKSLADYGMSGRSTGLKLQVSAQTKGIEMGSPVMVSASASQIDVFAIGFDGQLYHRWLDSSNKWHGPVNLNGAGLAGSPTAVSWGPNRIDVFARGSDGNLYHWWTDGNNQWSGPENRGGGNLSGSPAAVSRAANSLDVLAIGTDGNLYHYHWDNQQWYGPDNWGPGNLTNNPSAIAMGPDAIAVYALGTDGDLYQTVWWNFGFQVGPTPLLLGLDLGLLVDSPSAVLFPGFNAICVAIRASNGQICLYSNETILGWGFGFWQPVLFVQGNFLGSPVAVVDGPAIQIFAIGADGDLYNAPWAFTPLPFQTATATSLGGDGNLLGSPAALSPQLGALEVAAVGSAGHWFYTSYGASGWPPLTDLGNGNMVAYPVRSTTAYVQSDQLQLAGVPVIGDIPAGEVSIMLNTMVLGLEPGQPVALSGMRADAPSVSANEIQFIRQIDHSGGFTTLTFQQALQYSYQRATLTMSANVTAATNGATVQEVLGNGDGSKPNQSFTLKKPPLTFVAASTPSGVASTLQVTVNNLAWREAPTLYGLSSSDQDYVVRLADDGTPTITFGEPAARLKSGQQNVRAKYRTQIGLAGNVGAGSISTLMSRPPGLRAVTNPLPATGGGDPQPIDQARDNAPLTVLTLERVVSLADYENFAHAFAGVGKAQAIAVWSGETRLVHLTVAASDGTSVVKGSFLYTTLRNAIVNLKDPVQTFLLAGYQPLPFNLTAAILVDKTNYDSATVQAAAASALSAAFSFPMRAFAQAATEAEIVTLIQSVPGVLACNLSQLYLTSDPSGPAQTEPPPFLAAAPARWENGAIQPAQLLLLNAAGVTLKEMAP